MAARHFRVIGDLTAAVCFFFFFNVFEGENKLDFGLVWFEFGPCFYLFIFQCGRLRENTFERKSVFVCLFLLLLDTKAFIFF